MAEFVIEFEVFYSQSSVIKADGRENAQISAEGLADVFRRQVVTKDVRVLNIKEKSAQEV